MTQVKFEMNEDLLRSVIKRQAGSVEKAIMEGIQNALDSNATEVSLRIANDEIEIIDNGDGMSKEIIMNNWKTFGKSTKVAGSGKIGEFGMGRGQMFAFGVTTVLTKKFRLVTDIETSISFNFEDIDEEIKGTKVSIKLYDDKKIASYALDTIVYKIRQAVLSNIKVTINGEVLEKISEKRLLKIDEDFDIFQSPSKCSLYTKGIFIKDLEKDLMIDSYTINAHDLDLNFARNDWMVNAKSAKLLKVIDNINVNSLENWDNRKVFSANSALENLLAKGIAKAENLQKLKFVPTYEGASAYSVKSLKEMGSIYNVNSLDRKIAYFYSNQLKNQGLTCIEADDQVVRILSKYFGVEVKDAAEAEELSKIRELLNNSQEYTVVDIEKLSPRIKENVKFAKFASQEIARELHTNKREISFVETDRFSGVTDGDSYIKLNVSLLKMSHADGMKSGVFNVIIHEYCHDSDSSNGSHDINFYNRFHDAVMRLGKLSFTLFAKSISTMEVD